MLKSKRISAFNYFGGKNNPIMLEFILSKIYLTDVLHLAEPFGGSFAVSLNCRSAQIKTFNDLNEEIFNFFCVLRDNPDKLIRLLQLTPYSRQDYEELSLKPAKDSTERARRFFVRTMQSFGAYGSLKTYNSWSYAVSQSARGVAASTGRWLKKVSGLEEVVEAMRHVQLEKMDYKDFILKYDTPDTLFYVDPPYDQKERAMHQKYLYELDETQQVELADLLKCIKGRFLLSGYNSDLYNELYKDFYSDSISNITTHVGTNRTEVLWANYPKNTKKNGKLFHC